MVLWTSEAISMFSLTDKQEAIIAITKGSRSCQVGDVEKCTILPKSPKLSIFIEYTMNLNLHF